MGENLYSNFKLVSSCRLRQLDFNLITFLFFCPHEIYACDIEFKNTQSYGLNLDASFMWNYCTKS